MDRTAPLRIGALAASAALLASLALVTAAATTSAAPPRCGGQVATIVGTAEGETLVGTAGNDVIVARGGDDIIRGGGGQDSVCGDGGDDRIYGQAGMDKLFGKTGGDQLYGGAGADLLAGQAGNDRLDGGSGIDTCYQAGGSGLLRSCELPSTAPAPTPGRILAIAYSDLDGNHQFDPALDVLISKLIDTDGNGLDVGDRVEMGRYPITFNPIRPERGFEEWAVKSHTVTEPTFIWEGKAVVKVGANEGLQWLDDWQADQFDERIDGTLSAFVDSRTTNMTDFIQLDPATPSQPVEYLLQYGARDTTDHRFVDAEIYP
jgi:hypothetical protein